MASQYALPRATATGPDARPHKAGGEPSPHVTVVDVHPFRSYIHVATTTSVTCSGPRHGIPLGSRPDRSTRVSPRIPLLRPTVTGAPGRTRGRPPRVGPCSLLACRRRSRPAWGRDRWWNRRTVWRRVRRHRRGLLLSAAHGDQEAFVSLQSRMAGLVWLNIRRVLRDASRSEAAIEETFAEVREAAVHSDPHRSSAETWLLTLAHQHAMDGPRSIDNTADPHHTQIARSASVSSP